MNHSTIRNLLLSASFFVVAHPQNLSAASFGVFEYTDNGSTITIDGIGATSEVNFVIPPIIDGKPVTTIGQYAFYGRQQIKSILIPPSVTTIGTGAFVSCRQLTSLSIPSGVTVIEPGTFSSCDKLTTINLPGTVIQIGADAFSYCKSLKSFQMPDAETSIREDVFRECTSLTTVTYSQNVTSIGAGAFSGCVNLTTAPNLEKITSLGEFAFAGSGITKIVIPDNVKSIGQWAFSYCPNLRTVVIGNGLSIIDDKMFTDCTALTHVTLPDTVRIIGTSAFQGCALTQIDLKGVRQIAPNAFTQCGQLTTVTIPRSVNNIGTHAFYDCGQLASAVFEGNAPTMGTLVFGKSAPEFQVIVSDESKRFTVPRWQGYRLSLPKEEIAVQLVGGEYIFDSAHSAKFGIVLEGKRSAPTLYTIRNVGNRKLKGLSALIRGGDAKDFQITIPMKGSLAPGKSTTLGIAFKPKDKGKRKSTLQIMSSDANESPFEIALSGIGLRELK
jgi:hypothetical protein